MPSQDAQLLLADCGGLLKQGNLSAGLDLIVGRLETVGWAACPLGVQPGIFERSCKEARSLEGRMAPGATVVRNKVVDQRLPNAKRGDKIVWMQEEGLSGPDGASSATPTLALLENAIAEVGLQLDTRLQRSRLRLRITERCDGMLACYDGDGAAYGAHVDNADGDGRIDGRVLAVILYLNSGWDRANGGALGVFEPEAGDLAEADVEGRWHLVWPEAGTLVVFRADRMLHEVRPAHAPRYALSMWFCGQAVE